MLNITILNGGNVSDSDKGAAGSAIWGGITGTLSNQTDLQTALNAKPNEFTGSANPTVNDDNTQGYSAGDIMVNQSNNEAFICISASTGAAVWKNITGQGGDTQFPVYVAPTISLSADQSGTKEVGVAISVALTAVFTKNDAGAPTSIEILKDGVQIATVSNPTGTNTTNLPSQFGFANANIPNQTFTLEYTDSYTPSSAADVVYTARANYGAGNANKDSDGNDDTRTPAVRQTDAPQAAGTNFTSSAHTISFVYPYFYGVSDTSVNAAGVVALIEAGSGTKVLGDASGTISVTFGNTSNKYLWLAHVSADPTKTSWYISELNNDSIPGTLFGTPATNQAVNIPSGASAVDFTIYFSEYATTPAGTMQFRN